MSRTKLVGGPFDGCDMDTGDREPEVVMLCDEATNYWYVLGAGPGDALYYSRAEDANSDEQEKFEAWWGKWGGELFPDAPPDVARAAAWAGWRARNRTDLDRDVHGHLRE
jgi:hypothetical protein